MLCWEFFPCGVSVLPFSLIASDCLIAFWIKIQYLVLYSRTNQILRPLIREEGTHLAFATKAAGALP